MSPPSKNNPVDILCSGAFINALRRIAEPLEAASGRSLHIVQGSSRTCGSNAIPVRLAAGERCDVVILFDEAIDRLSEKSLVHSGSKVSIAESYVGVCVNKAAPAACIDTVEQLREVILGASNIAYSSSSSGDYVSRELFHKLGIEDQVSERAFRVDGERVGDVVARGDATLGFQQMSELVDVAGVTVLGAVPAPVQKITLLSAAVASASADPAAAGLVIQHLLNCATAEALASAGLRPAARSETP
jgi:molybdate transport system substrate-binding protein